MITEFKGTGLTDLTLVLEQINLSQRGKSNPKPIKVAYEYDSVTGSFSVSVEEIKEG